MNRPTRSTGGPYPDGEDWTDYHCTTCGTPIDDRCDCDADDAPTTEQLTFPVPNPAALVDAGAVAFARGDRRIIPRTILVEHGITAAKAWYRGWDRANLAAEVPID